MTPTPFRPVLIHTALLVVSLLFLLAMPAAAQAPPTNFSHQCFVSDTGLPRSEIRALARDPVETSTLYAQVWEGISKSVDNGRSWLPVTDHPGGTDIVIDPANPATVYVTGYLRGVVKTIDGGATWYQKNEGFPNGNYPRAVAIAPTTPNVVYAGLHDVYSGSPPGGVYRSIDGAETWSYVGLDHQAVYDILVHPTDPDLVYVAGWQGLFISYDGGEHWTERHPDLPSPVSSLAVDPHNPDIMYAGTREGDGIFRSTDAGNSWLPTGLATGGARLFGVSEINVDPEWPYPVNAATAYGVFASLDGGASWHNLGCSGNYFSAVTYDPEEPGRGVLAGRFGLPGGVFRGLRLDARQFLPLMIRRNTGAGVPVIAGAEQESQHSSQSVD